MKERNIQVNKLDTIAVLTISLIVKGKNGHKYFEFLLRESEAQREIKKVRERERGKDTERQRKRHREKNTVRDTETAWEKGETGDRETPRETRRDIKTNISYSVTVFLVMRNWMSFSCNLIQWLPSTPSIGHCSNSSQPHLHPSVPFCHSGINHS